MITTIETNAEVRGMRSGVPQPRPRDPDGDVLSMLSNGEASRALRLLMQRHGVAVYRYCREALNDATLADDVHQQVFISAYRDLPKFAGRSTVRTWLFGIARHRVLDAAKSRRRQQACNATLAELVDVSGSQPSAIESLNDMQLHKLLVASLKDLAEPARSAVLLRYQQGFTFEEMASICGESPGALHIRVTRALQQLRTAIESQIQKPKGTRRAEDDEKPVARRRGRLRTELPMPAQNEQATRHRDSESDPPTLHVEQASRPQYPTDTPAATSATQDVQHESVLNRGDNTSERLPDNGSASTIATKGVTEENAHKRRQVGEEAERETMTCPPIGEMKLRQRLCEAADQPAIDPLLDVVQTGHTKRSLCNRARPKLNYTIAMGRVSVHQGSGHAHESSLRCEGTETGGFTVEHAREIKPRSYAEYYNTFNEE